MLSEHDRENTGTITFEDFKHMMLGIDEIVDKIEEDESAFNSQAESDDFSPTPSGEIDSPENLKMTKGAKSEQFKIKSMEENTGDIA